MDLSYEKGFGLPFEPINARPVRTEAL